MDELGEAVIGEVSDREILKPSKESNPNVPPPPIKPKNFGNLIDTDEYHQLVDQRLMEVRAEIEERERKSGRPSLNKEVYAQTTAVADVERALIRREATENGISSNRTLSLVKGDNYQDRRHYYEAMKASDEELMSKPLERLLGIVPDALLTRFHHLYARRLERGSRAKVASVMREQDEMQAGVASATQALHAEAKAHGLDTEGKQITNVIGELGPRLEFDKDNNVIEGTVGSQHKALPPSTPSK